MTEGLSIQNREVARKLDQIGKVILLEAERAVLVRALLPAVWHYR